MLAPLLAILCTVALSASAVPAQHDGLLDTMENFGIAEALLADTDHLALRATTYGHVAEYLPFTDRESLRVTQREMSATIKYWPEYATPCLVFDRSLPADAELFSTRQKLECYQFLIRHNESLAAYHFASWQEVFKGATKREEYGLDEVKILVEYIANGDYDAVDKYYQSGGWRFASGGLDPMRLAIHTLDEKMVKLVACFQRPHSIYVQAAITAGFDAEFAQSLFNIQSQAEHSNIYSAILQNDVSALHAVLESRDALSGGLFHNTLRSVISYAIVLGHMNSL